MTDEAASRLAIERAVRESFGRLVAYLSARTRDVAGAEDALSEAVVAALERWPRDGLPDNPEAWLLAAARRRLVDRHRRGRVAEAATQRLVLAAEEAEAAAMERDGFPDERLRLMFVCAHPAIDPALHAPLMLQTVLGVDARAVAGLALVSPEAMAQRLVRAKTKIREAGIAFAMPERDRLAGRLDGVLAAIYGAFTLGFDGTVSEAPDGGSMAGEAIHLARLVATLMPQGETQSLLALMLFCEARRDARRAPGTGAYVPLDAQDTARWSAAMIDEADALLTAAGRHGPIGRFGYEAAIQAVHAARRRTGRTDWQALVWLYRALVMVAPTAGALAGLAGALGRAGDPARGLAELDRIADRSARYQPYHAVRASLLEAIGRQGEAMDAYSVAAGMAADPAVRAHLLQRRARLAGPVTPAS